MSSFPPVSAARMIRALGKIGYVAVRTKGSHVRLKHPIRAAVTVPLHKELGQGLALKILRDAALKEEEFIRLL